MVDAVRYNRYSGTDGIGRSVRPSSAKWAAKNRTTSTAHPSVLVMVSGTRRIELNRAGVDANIGTSPDTLLTISQESPLPQKGKGVNRVPVNGGLRIGSRELTTGSGTHG